MLGDPHSNLATAFDMKMDNPGPYGKFGQQRSKRFSALFVNGKLKILNLAERGDDPAGDDHPENSLVEKMIKDMEAHRFEL
jgi:peroxiredoxin